MNSKERLLKGKICLITGCNKGIGKAIAERFAEEGAIVYANARKVGSLDEWSTICSGDMKTEVIPIYFDVTDHSAVKQAVMLIKKQHQRIDVLVNNAGMVTYGLLASTQLDNVRAMLEVNVIAVIQLIQLISRLMMRQNSGSIINISSIVGVEGVQGQLAYSATKGALNALTKSAAKEFAQSNIRVNAIAPGMVDTERFRTVMNNKFKDRITAIGMGRLAKPEEIADSCVFLASDLSSYITGQVIKVDGSTII